MPHHVLGAFGYPLEEAARVALRSVMETAAGLEQVKRVRFVLFDEDTLRVFESALGEDDNTFKNAKGVA